MNFRIILLSFLMGYSPFTQACSNKSVLKDSIGLITKRYLNSLYAFGQVSTYTKAVGIKYCGAFQLKNHPRVRVGPSLFYEHIEFKDNVKLPRNVVEGKFFVITPGLNIETRLAPIVLLQFGASVLLGSETLKRVTSSTGTVKIEENGIGGLHLEQNFFLKTSETNGGLRIGIGAFERFISGTFYENDFGGRVYIGFEF